MSGVTRVWLSLVALTIGSWWIAEHGASPAFAATLVVLVAAVKVHLVIDHFMELRWRPLPWRLPFEGWIVAAVIVIAGGSWLARY